MLPERVFAELGSNPGGLTWEEARRRLREYGPNVLVTARRRWRLARRFLKHLVDPLSLLLIVAAVLSLVIGSEQLGAAIFALTLLNATLNTLQEWRAERAVEKLKAWMPFHAKVLRDGKVSLVPVSEIVPGDVIVLEEGDKVPADAVLFEAHDMMVSNVPLTGESTPQPKFADAGNGDYSSYIEMPNVVLAGTTVVRGWGKAVVFATGRRTVFGGVVGLTQEAEEGESPLEREVAVLARRAFLAAVISGSVFLLVSVLFLKQSFFNSVLFTIGVMVAVVPEGLQITVSMALALAVLDMVKRNVLVRRLSVVQALGSVTVICTDKTGTITKGEMTVTRVWLYDRDYEVTGQGYEPRGSFLLNGSPAGDDPDLKLLLTAAVLSSTAYLQPPRDPRDTWKVVGDPTDGAILVAGLKLGVDRDKLLKEYTVLRRSSLDPVKKTMYTVCERGGRKYLFLKGAPRGVLNSSAKILVGGEARPLDSALLARVEEKVREMGEAGLRVIAVAYGEDTEVDGNLVFLGLMGMIDPPRPEVPEFVAKAKRGGIRVLILTGDYGPTAKAIARKVGIVGDDARIVKGSELDKMSDEELAELLKGEVVLSRVTPEQKLRILRVLKRSGEVVAMVGDGVNDAPSLKEADVGVAMGLSGTDVAREAADIVLLDDSFASIVRGIEAGRAVFDNIKKFVTYVFTHNWAELLPFLVFITTGIPLPLTVTQVLAIDLGIDVLPSLALSRQPPEEGVMDEPPKSKFERLFDGKVIARSLVVGFAAAALALYLCLSAWAEGGWTPGMALDPSSPVYLRGVTTTFAGIALAQAGNLLTLRRKKGPMVDASLLRDKWILSSLAAQLLLLLVLIYLPPLQLVFQTYPLAPGDWLRLLPLPAVVVALAYALRKMGL